MKGSYSCKSAHCPGASGPSRRHTSLGLLTLSLKELAFFPRCQEAYLLQVLLRYCVSLFRWPVQTPQAQEAMGQGKHSWEELGRSPLSGCFFMMCYKTASALGGDGWVYSLMRTAAPFAAAEIHLQAWLALQHEYVADGL